MKDSAAGLRRLRHDAGLLLRDWPAMEWLLAADRRGRKPGWTLVRNRNDSVAFDEGREGIECLWPWSREIELCRRYPAAGARLFRHSLLRWPAAFADAPDQVGEGVTFLIGHRGRKRLPGLLTTLRSIAGQAGVAARAVVVEQSHDPEIREAMPEWVRHVHQPVPGDRPFCRSQAFNAAAELADTEALIFHDGDMVVPAHYAREHVEILREGWDAVQLKRYVFYLDEASSPRFEASPATARPLGVVQNLLGGGSVGMTKEAFRAIGGFDEDFVGWGGEDEEFWDRARTLRLWSRAHLPLWHLFHDPQPMKRDPANPTRALLGEKLREPAVERIRRLVVRREER